MSTDRCWEKYFMTFSNFKKIPLQAVLVIAMLPFAAQAAPSITSVAGTPTHGQSITITGSGFGTHAVYSGAYLPVAYKDFEDNSLTSQGFSAGIPADVALQSGGPTNSTKYGKVFYGGSSRLANYGIQSQSGNDLGAIYTSFWFMMPAGTEGGKMWRWYFGPNSSADNLYIGTACQNPAFNLGGDGLGTTVYGGGFSTDVWHKFEVYASQPDNVYTVWLDGSLYSDWITAKGSINWTAMSPDGHSVHAGHMIDGTTTGCGTTGSFNYDDIYMDYTQARVEICSGSTWSNRGMCNTQLPTSWNTTSIIVKVNKGTFAQGASQYLYAIDADGNASSGKQITFGSSGSGGGSTSKPAAPKNLSVH